jgi:hypothetical protein
MKKQLIFILIAINFNFFNCNFPASSKWKSQYYNFEIEYSNKWTVYEKSDTKDRLRYGLIDKSDGKQYQIDMTTQSEHKNLSNEEYLNEMKKYYLSLNSKNKFLSEEEIELHGEKFYGNSFLFYNEKYGVQKLYDIVIRNKDFVVGIIMYFPADESNYQTQTIPDELFELDKHVKINGNY